MPRRIIKNCCYAIGDIGSNVDTTRCMKDNGDRPGQSCKTCDIWICNKHPISECPSCGEYFGINNDDEDDKLIGKKVIIVKNPGWGSWKVIHLFDETEPINNGKYLLLSILSYDFAIRSHTDIEIEDEE